jgi:signal transduction histidine kinase
MTTPSGPGGLATPVADTLGATLSAMARAASLEESSLDDVLRGITETAARTLEVARVNVWLYDSVRAAIQCVVNFDRRTGTFTSGEILEEKDAPSYFRALHEMRTIAAIDADGDPRTAELRESYLLPLGITTLLDAPIIRSGRVAGVVCHEHVGPERGWAQHEQLFAGHVADLVALVLETDRRLAAERERRELERRVQTMERLEGLGLLAGAVAHDFNNMLTVVRYNAELLLQDLGDGAARAAATDIRDVSRRATEMCRQLLRFSGRHELTMEPVDLSALAAELTRLMSKTVPRNVRLEVEAREVPLLTGDPAALHQVALNMVANAVDAVREPGGAVVVRTRTESWDGSERTRTPHDWRGKAGTYALLEVEDDGVGMDEATQRRIFEPFFTTKEHGHGLGLSSALGTIRSHHGALEVRSAPRSGCTMRVLLPLGDWAAA